MKLKLLGGAALAIALAVSSGAWANPKNSFSSGNNITVNSNANADAEAGTTSGKCNNCTVFSSGGASSDGGDNSQNNNRATATAESESFNVSIEAVETSALTAYSTNNFVYEYNSGNLEWRDAIANATGDGSLHQAQASNGVGSVNAAIQSVAAAADVRF